MRRTLPVAVCAMFALACGGSTAEEPAEPPPTTGEEAAEPTAEAPAEPIAAAGRSGTGASAEDPVSACGPADSYKYVGTEFRCPDGTNPLGDESAGMQARVGNVGANSRGHIIDRYSVPCAGGPVEVFVDMYGCPEMEERLRSFTP